MSAAEIVIAAYFVVAIALSIVAAWWAARRAREKGRRPWLWAALGLLFGIFAIGAVTLMPRVTPARSDQ